MTPILVAGLGRCGSSLVMQMIHAAGVRCLGEFPAFEPDDVSIAGRDVRNLLEMPAAMKILCPHRDVWPLKFDAKIIWLNRDLREQAKSQVKMLQMFGHAINSQAWRRIAKGMENESLLCRRWCRQSTIEPLSLRFEDVINNPFPCATLLAQFIGQGDPQEMADCVVQRMRGGKCEPGIDIEMGLVVKADSPVWAGEGE